ncbi:hypothetical protein NITMOv2_3887 [Nitrospira moscoviensis]|uniref:Uncharacterized protein n=1 Tax=Nitrospira moscoviensis TaxID=42253 RepID=A0A0K2GHE2_NITMO|nr:hypothetical protein NITMOv2_3887 [Nitrospira moscoviensis]
MTSRACAAFRDGGGGAGGPMSMARAGPQNIPIHTNIHVATDRIIAPLDHHPAHSGS